MVKGRAYQLLRSCLGDKDPPSARNAFIYARIIMRARVVPEEITPALDDPEIERRLEHALEEILRRA
ncbi:hypothetical protein BE04_37825 [Sorangium cellulosum]|uniref:Uncharacterized protein n=2 Tax=Sorangium cellulosum TaxID=56 RepID=A0A150PUZ5_SORCE|nr:hypothetical protein SCE1572_29455 [Sorangium cellulosum So0157-2]KYF59502.1 hypothetical protein BE04_37825 [Sorangium cellulosum]KYG09517.1 hypothetical protein BE21_01605 [Sorangium cellulosum]